MKRQFEAAILKLGSLVQKYMFFHEWRVKVQFHDKPKAEDKGDNMCAADIHIQDEYLDILINVYPLLQEKYAQGQARTVVEAVIHEFCHVLTDPLYKVAVHAICNREIDALEATRERQTQRICNVIMQSVPSRVFKLVTYKPKPRSKSRHKSSNVIRSKRGRALKAR